MPYFDREDIQRLSRLKTEPYWVTSVFLATDKSLFSKKQISLNVKNLLAEARTRLEQLPVSKEIRSSLEADLETVAQSMPSQLNSLRHPGIAILSCSGKGFLETFNLPHPPRNRVIFDPNPYLRPLMAILERYHRICVLLLSRRQAKWYQVFMGEASLLETLTSDVPGKVREGGWEGYESKRIERHIEAHVHDHLKMVSQKTFNLFKQKPFDWLFLGCEDKLFSDFEPLLHNYLKEKLKARIKVKTTDSPEKIRHEATELETKLKREEEKKAVERLVTELEAGGAAVAGLKETLRQINANNIQMLLVSHNFSRPGRFCPACRFLYLEEKTCPACKQPTTEASDIVDEALGFAMVKAYPVRQITPPSRLDHYGKIGALLRYKA
jgi:peptide subunit release factor 1 (eRF1)